jgi:hypothetical protein
MTTLVLSNILSQKMNLPNPAIPLFLKRDEERIIES